MCALLHHQCAIFNTPTCPSKLHMCPFQQFECPSNSQDALFIPRLLFLVLCSFPNHSVSFFSLYMYSSTTNEPFSIPPYALLSPTHALSSNLNAVLTPRMPFLVLICPSHPMHLSHPSECPCQSQHAALGHKCGHGARAWRARNKGMGQEHVLVWGKATLITANVH